MQLYHFLAALPALLALSGFVLYQMLGANRSGDEITRRIVDKLRRNAPGEAPDHRLSAKQVEHLLATRQRLQEIAGQQDFQLLQQALKQQFFISLLVYVITIAFVAWSVYLFVRQSQIKKELSVKQIVLNDRQSEAGSWAVDLDPLTVTWEAEGEPEDVKVFLENVDSAARTDPKVASSSETALTYAREEYSALLTFREKGEANRLRAVVQARKDAFRSEPVDVKVGFTMLTVADATGIDVAAMIDNSRIAAYGFEGRVVVPSRDTNQGFLSIGPAIPYAFRKVRVPHPDRYDWNDVKAVYLGPDDSRLVRYQYLVDDSLKTQPNRASLSPRKPSATVSDESRDTAFLLGYDAAFAVAHARLGTLSKQETSRIASYLRQLKLSAGFPEDPLGPGKDAQPAAEFAQAVLGSLEAISQRQSRAFALGWLGVITTNSPTLKPKDFDLRSFVREAGYAGRTNLSDTELLDQLASDVRKRRK